MKLFPNSKQTEFDTCSQWSMDVTTASVSSNTDNIILYYLNTYIYMDGHWFLDYVVSEFDL